MELKRENNKENKSRKQKATLWRGLRILVSSRSTLRKKPLPTHHCPSSSAKDNTKQQSKTKKAKTQTNPTNRRQALFCSEEEGWLLLEVSLGETLEAAGVGRQPSRPSTRQAQPSANPTGSSQDKSWLLFTFDLVRCHTPSTLCVTPALRSLVRKEVTRVQHPTDRGRSAGSLHHSTLGRCYPEPK